MPRLPRQVTQQQVVRALIRCGGVEERNRGKGSHRLVYMPGATRPVVVPDKIKTGLLSGIIKQAGLTIDQFIEAM